MMIIIIYRAGLAPLCTSLFTAGVSRVSLAPLEQLEPWCLVVADQPRTDVSLACESEQK